MKITAPFRGRRASKKLDLTDMRKAFADQRLWCSIGLVTAPDDGASHFEVTATDVLVEVVLQPSLIPLTCRLSAALWRVPDLGEEVMVTVPEGMIEFMPTITDVLSSGRVPTGQGPATGRIVITRTEVVVHDGAGGANPLPTLAEHNDLVTKVNALVIKFNALVTSFNGLTLPVSGGTAGPTPPAQQVLPANPATSATGTTVLKGK
jgi:hypothetical protein